MSDAGKISTDRGRDWPRAGFHGCIPFSIRLRAGSIQCNRHYTANLVSYCQAAKPVPSALRGIVRPLARRSGALRFHGDGGEALSLGSLA